MRKYDKNGTGKLEKDELKSYLTDVNNGVPPTDKEVDWVVRSKQKRFFFSAEGWVIYRLIISRLFL